MRSTFSSTDSRAFLLCLTVILLEVVMDVLVCRPLIILFFEERMACYIFLIPPLYLLVYFLWVSLLLAVIVYMYFNPVINWSSIVRVVEASLLPILTLMLPFTMVYTGIVLGFGREIPEEMFVFVVGWSIVFDLIMLVFLFLYPPFIASIAGCNVEGGVLEAFKCGVRVFRREWFWLLISSIEAGIIGTIVYYATLVTVADILPTTARPIIPLPENIENVREMSVLGEYAVKYDQAIAGALKLWVYANVYSRLSRNIIRG